jgi:hypothetical protein
MFKALRDSGDRERLNPRRVLSMMDVTEYLIFYSDPQKPYGISHRFVIDGGYEYTKTRGEIKKVIETGLFEKTSVDEIESISDILSMIFEPIIIVNLSKLYGMAILLLEDLPGS